MKKQIYVSGLLNFETILGIDTFPVQYCPIEYPFDRIHSTVSGTAYNISKALKTLGNKVTLSSHVGKDLTGRTIVSQIKKARINVGKIDTTLESTPNQVVLVDYDGNTKTYCDLKNIQYIESDPKIEEEYMKDADLVVLCNNNFNRPLLKKAKELGKKIATDVHIIGDVHDEFNEEFIANSDILFLSSKGLANYNYEDFLLSIYNKYHNEIIVLGEGREGAMILDSKKHMIYHIDAITLRPIVNTVGSRDALFSAFLHYYLKGKDSLECLKLAEVFTSYKIGEAGGSNGFLKQPALNKLRKEVSLTVYEIKSF